jgi:hypothetical protein
MRQIALVITSLLALACTTTQAQTAAHVVSVSADVCEAIARAKGRDDLAALCRATSDGAQILDRATEPDVCAVPDAGAER